MHDNTHTLEVWGDLACFTRPEMKVERFSYPVITPSAARGIFDAIYWDGRREQRGKRSVMQAYFYWQVTRIEVLKTPRYIALRRNEVKGVVPGNAVLNKWMSGAENPEPLWADGDDQSNGRTQRQTMALKDVRYRITARIVPKGRFGPNIAKFNATFERRAKQGKCFQQPYFGCREFPAFYEYVEAEDTVEYPPIALDQHLGFMLYDVFDLAADETPDATAPFISVFDAAMKAGVIEVPAFDSPAVRKPREA
ncbi:MAG: type I-C CRISPR-associated protein Cas5c [Leptothrix sp. (in: b-proteobacteria)]